MFFCFRVIQSMVFCVSFLVLLFWGVLANIVCFEVFFWGVGLVFGVLQNRGLLGFELSY